MSSLPPTTPSSRHWPTRSSYGAAASDVRAIVTENAKDFDRIARAWSLSGEHHAGVVFTSPHRYRRATKAYPANLVAGLASLLSDPPADQVDMIHWLA